MNPLFKEGRCHILVLTRGKSEAIHIGDNITVTVVEVRGDKVRLGISAPPDVAIVRDDAKVRLEPVPSEARVVSVREVDVSELSPVAAEAARVPVGYSMVKLDRQ